MNLIMNFDLDNKKPEPTIVKLTTECWRDDKGIYQRKKLTYLKRKGSGWMWFDEDADCGGVEEIFLRISNFDECPDGIYEIITCNVTRDWESGYVDDWDYELSPYKG